MKLYEVPAEVSIDLGEDPRIDELGELAAASGIIAAIRRSQGFETAAKAWEKAGDAHNAKLTRVESQSPRTRV